MKNVIFYQGCTVKELAYTLKKVKLHFSDSE